MRALGIALLAFAVVWPSRPWLRPVVAIAGAVALMISTWHASFQGRANEWAVVIAVVVAVAGWWAAPHAGASLVRLGGAWWVLMGSAIAVYGCVPETDQLREVGVVVVAGGLAEVLLQRRMPTPVLVAAMALVEWSALYGATGQARALAGGLFALTPLLAVAAVARLVGSRTAPSWLFRAVGGVWVVAAVVMARTGGIATSLMPAAAAAAVCGGAAVVLSAGLVRLARR